VEIWSKIMRSAHQSVPVAGLPGLSTGPALANILPPFNAPTPPAPLAPAANTPQQNERNSGMDGWLLDRLFGRR
jgi:hypothetical protein